VPHGKNKKQPRSRTRKCLLGLVTATLALAFLEGLTSIGWTSYELFALWSNGPRVVELREEYHCEYDSELGWANRNGAEIVDFYGPGQSVTIDEHGLRSHERLNGSLNQKAMRVVCLGDSFTFGYGVDDQQTFPYILQERGNGQLNVANMGQGGYSIGQNWLWLRRTAPMLKPDIVVCVFIVEDFRRLASTRTANGFGAPHFTFNSTGLVVSNTPVPEKLSPGELILQPSSIGNSLRRSSSIARTLSLALPSSNSASDAELLVTGLLVLRKIKQFCREQQCQVVFALTPTLPELSGVESKLRYEEFSHSVHDFMARENVPFVDLQSAFLAEGIQFTDLFLNEEFHHYNSAGNALVATELHKFLSHVVPGFPTP